MEILNLTQHAASGAQVAAGVRELPVEERRKLCELLTFEDLPTSGEILERAISIAEMAAFHNAKAAMIGGAPWLMRALERALMERWITPYYAFSRREVREERLPDGSVRKTSIFEHTGFIPVV